MNSISRGEAYGVLELPIGADADAIRTSYKRLAQKWYPEKNPKSEEAVQKFQRINLAYKRLITDNENVSMSKDQMYELYKQVMYPKYRNAMLDDDCGSSCDQDSCTTSDSDNDPLSGVLNYFGRSTNKKKHQQDRGDGDSESESPLTAEQRERLANELITEEEKKKRQLEKRRLKKKQRREKKRLEKQEPTKQETSKKPEKRKDETSSSSSRTNKTNSVGGLVQPSYDSAESYTASVFSSRSADVTGKLKNYDHNHAATPSPPVKRRDNASEEVDPVVLQSRQFAIQGNNMACQGQYVTAIECFTKAIQLDGSDYRFFGNRSYCYERLSQFDKALKDANKVISLASDWPKGYFRKGKALAGLKNYQAAEEAFMQVLKLDSKCEDARQELNVVRTNQLVEMGFGQQQAQSAATQYETVQQALDSLLAGLVSENPALSDVYISDEEVPAEPVQQSSKVPQTQTATTAVVNSRQTTTTTTTTTTQPAATAVTNRANKKNNEPLPPIPQHHYDQAARQIQQSRHVPATSADDIKMDPSNPEGLTSLWVGNVQPVVTQGALEEMFSQFGSLQSVRVLPDKYCAFVNFVSKECAGRAMQGLQGTVLAGQPLLVKFPDNPLTSSGGALIEKPAKSASKSASTAVAAAVAASKLRGPVNGDECYFWRTTGCQFTTGCRYRHIPEHKGIDKKPWQKSAK